MKVFLDANVLVTVLNKEYPLFSDASRILSGTDNGKIEAFTSPICLAIAFYFAEKKSGAGMAGKKIRLLVSHINIAAASKDAVLKTLSNKKIIDFEDGLEYYFAIESGCQVIITEDQGDFHFSEIEVLNCGDFMKKYLTGSL
jgi:predicted nucleic acid-binding protein